MVVSYNAKEQLQLHKLTEAEMDVAYAITDKWLQDCYHLSGVAGQMIQIEPDQSRHAALKAYADHAMRFLLACLMQLENADERRSGRSIEDPEALELLSAMEAAKDALGLEDDE